MDKAPVHDRNADQAAYWNGAAGRRWTDRQEMLDLCLDLLGNYLRPATQSNGRTTKTKRLARKPQVKS